MQGAYVERSGNLVEVWENCPRRGGIGDRVVFFRARKARIVQPRVPASSVRGDHIAGKVCNEPIFPEEYLA